MFLIIRRLIALEYLDTSKVKINDFTFYDSLLADYVKRFQKNNGLNDDGVIGKGTVEKINITPQQYINKIKINLERFRWNDYPDTGKYILVNVPDFMLNIFDSGKKVFITKVCTGSKRSSYYKEQFKSL